MRNFHLPTSWSGITLKQLSELENIIKDDTFSGAEKDTMLLCLLSGKTPDFILSLPLKTKNADLRKLRFLNDLNAINRKMQHHFTIKGSRFRLILNATELTGGQYIDLVSFLKNTDALHNNIHNVLAVIALPLKMGFIKRTYDGKEHAARAKLFFESMPVSVAYPILIFFCNLSANLIQGITDYLKANTMMKLSLAQKQMKAFINDSAGS